MTTRLEELTTILTDIKNNESECSQRATLDVWIECMEGDYTGVPEVAEYVALRDNEP